jgi:hypothetical protein
VRQSIEKDVRKPYQKPTLTKLTFEQAKRALLGQAKEFLERFRPNRRQAAQEEVAKLYQSPKLKKLTLEQARMFLMGHASMGDEGAKDLLRLIYPDNRLGVGEIPATSAPASPDSLTSPGPS